jgi:hypothetical protein
LSFQPTRISRGAVITVAAPLERALELFGPIRQKDWAEGWDPQLIDPASEIVEERIVFTTQSHHGQEEPDDVWIVSAYSVADSFIEYTVFAHERIWWIEIACTETVPREQTKAEIAFTFLGLTGRGNSLNREALELIFADDLRDWEQAIDHYLKTGERKHIH